MRRIIATILALAASMGLLAVFSPAAFADGDPASDVLVYQPVFNPYNSGATPLQYAELQALVTYVSRHGYPLKVALIASSADLGTASNLWESPFNYAVFLGRELSLVFHGRLLVVMPQGYGLRDPFATNIPAGDQKAMSGLVAPGSDLVQGAYQVISRLASDNGITIPKQLAYTTPTAQGGGSSSSTPLIGFVVGLLAVALTWGISLRARPLRRRVAT